MRFEADELEGLTEVKQEEIVQQYFDQWLWDNIHTSRERE
ncbi:DUF7167 family protein [Brevibacillus sp. JB24b]